MLNKTLRLLNLAKMSNTFNLKWSSEQIDIL